MKKTTRGTIALAFLFSIFFQPAVHAQAPLARLDQSSTVVFNQQNADMSCMIHALLTHTGETERFGSFVILHTSTAYNDGSDITEFNISFDMDRGAISGKLAGSFYTEEVPGGYDSAELFAEITTGNISWDSSQNVWIFSGDVQMEVYLDAHNKIGADGDQIVYGDANLKTTVIGQISGASGPHEVLDEHGSVLPYTDGRFRFEFEEKDVPAQGSGQIISLEVSCYLDMPAGERMDSKFPAGLDGDASGGETMSQDQSAIDFDLADRNDQLGLFIATYGTDWQMLNQWQGWENLNETQKINLINLIQRLDTILALAEPVSAMGLELLEDEKRQEIIAQQAADMIQDELDIRKHIRETVWVETLRDTFGDSAVYLYQNYAVFEDVKSVYDSGASWIEKIRDPDSAASDQLIQAALGDAGTKTPEDITREAIENINTLATATSVYHYAYYRQIYDQKIQAGLSEEESHQEGMNALRARVSETVPGDIGNENDQVEQRVWGPAFNNFLAENGVYDHAFPTLNQRDAPRLNP